MLVSMQPRRSRNVAVRFAACAIALAGFFVFVGSVRAQITPPVSFDINGSLAPRGATLTGQTAVSFAGGVYSFSYSEILRSSSETQRCMSTLVLLG